MADRDPEEFDTGLLPTDVDPDEPRPLRTPWGAMALFTVAGEILCVQAFCPHLEGPLFQGSVAGGTVTCPWHSWRFDLRTGRRVDTRAEEDPRRLACSAVRRGPDGTIVLARPRGH